MKIVTIAAIVVAGAIGLACTGTDGNNTNETPIKPDPTIQQAKQPAHNPKKVGDGTWEVGTEIEVGTYTTLVPADASGCYWARLKNFEGSGDNIAANGVLLSGAKGRVTIKASDKGVEFSGGCIWDKVS